VSFLKIYTVSAIKSHPLYSGAIKAAVKVGKAVTSAVQGRRNRRDLELEFDERDLEFDEDLEMREPIRFGSAMLV